jgi:hypothetical protein
MVKHTKGPWEVRSGAVYTVEGNKPIATMVRSERATEAGITPVQRDMNTHLIAAAPELLEALEVALQNVHDFCEVNNSLEALQGESWWKNAKAAIKKATGE